jgi:hypothetical protein
MAPANQAWETITFKVERELLQQLLGVPNRSAFIRSALLQALGNICCVCHGTGVLTGRTPTGTDTIADRLIGPTWYWQGYAVPSDDPEYPLGSRWLGLSRRGYGIHGTNEPESIGKQESPGCIRMHNADVEEVFDVVSVGTPVTMIE